MSGRAAAHQTPNPGCRRQWLVRRLPSGCNRRPYEQIGSIYAHVRSSKDVLVSDYRLLILRPTFESLSSCAFSTADSRTLRKPIKLQSATLDRLHVLKTLWDGNEIRDLSYTLDPDVRVLNGSGRRSCGHVLLLHNLHRCLYTPD